MAKNDQTGYLFFCGGEGS